MPRHRAPHPDLAGYVLGILEPAESDAFAAHLAECSACRAEVAELSALPDLLRRADVAVEPPDDLRARTMAAVDAAADPPPRSRVRLAAASVAVAALLVVAVAAAALVAGNSSKPAPDEVFTAELASSPESAARGTARLRPTEQGVVVELEVAGLTAEGGGHYECWYVDASDGATRVSAGTFVTKADGTARVRMITAADPARFPRIVITREPDDGNPAPGEAVLWSRWDE
jgi:hypothetical protein